MDPKDMLWSAPAELRGHGEYGWECQFLYDGELFYGQRRDTHAAANTEAEAKKQELTGDGWTSIG